MENFFSELSETLTKGHQVKLSGFGNFEIKDKSQRPGRNPKTGEMVHVTARRVVTFKAGQKMRRVLKINCSQNKRFIIFRLFLVNLGILKSSYRILPIKHSVHKF